MASEVITNYAALPSTSEETMLLAPLMLPEVLNFKPTHARIYSPFQSNSSSLVSRPLRPAFAACSTKSGGRPGWIYHVMRAVADVSTVASHN